MRNNGFLRGCQSFSPFNRYNLFTSGDVVQSNVDWEGRGAVGGNARLSDFGIGHHITPEVGDPTLVVGGDLNWINGVNYSGDTVMREKTDYDVTNVEYDNANKDLEPIRTNNLPIDFNISFSYARCLASQLVTLNEAKTLIINCYGNIFLLGDSISVNIFNFNANKIAPDSNIVGGAGNGLNNITSLTIFTPEGSTNILNIGGTTVEFGNYNILRNTAVPTTIPSDISDICNKLQQGVDPSTEQKERILWNFYNATSVTMSSISLKGSLLAPRAILRAVSGNIEGNVIVKSLVPNSSMGDHTELHDYPFNGCIPPISCTVVDPGTTTTTSTTTSQPSTSSTTSTSTTTSQSSTSSSTSTTTSQSSTSSTSTTTSQPTTSTTTSTTTETTTTTTPAPPSPTTTSTTTGLPLTTTTTRACLCCIKGYLWRDCNRNGFRDCCDFYLCGARVKLYDNNGNCIKIANTDSSGEFIFMCVKPGKYCIKVSGGDGIRCNKEICLTINSGRCSLEINIPV